MPFITLTCPQCAAPLPRQASWRMVTCTFCGASVSRSPEVVQAAWFREASARVRADPEPPANAIRVGGIRYRILARLGSGTSSEVFLGARSGPFAERVTIKRALNPAHNASLAREAGILGELQALKIPGSAYFSQRLPQPVGLGPADGSGNAARLALVLRHPSGYWGSLADVLRVRPQGIDPRHAVWIWRRILDILGFIHAAGWAHGDVAAEHLLVHPADHGILLIGWAAAQPVGSRREADPARPGAARDLLQAAWTIRTLLAGGDMLPAIPAATPERLADLLRRASEDADWCLAQGAGGLDSLLQAAARDAFGPPQFVPFDPRA